MLRRVVVLLFFVQVSLGQTKSALELCIQYQNSINSFSSEKKVNESLDKILNVIGASKNFILVPCDDIRNALAVTFKGERLILFDEVFMIRSLPVDRMALSDVERKQSLWEMWEVF